MTVAQPNSAVSNADAEAEFRSTVGNAMAPRSIATAAATVSATVKAMAASASAAVFPSSASSAHPDPSDSCPSSTAFQPIARAAKARAGLLNIPGRSLPIQTPTWVATSSRGVVPHLSPDNFGKYGNVGGLYVSLEDFIEKGPRQTPPIYTAPEAASLPLSLSPTSSSAKSDLSPQTSRLHSFIGLTNSSPDTFTILSARRPNPVIPSVANTARSISVCTSVGFRELETTEYTNAVSLLRPDVAVLMADILYRRPDTISGSSRKRMEKMGLRSAEWVREAIELFKGVSLPKVIGVPQSRPSGSPERAEEGPGGAGEIQPKVPQQSPLLFAPVLPIPIHYQLQYLDLLAADEKENGFRSYVSGIVLPSPPLPDKKSLPLSAKEKSDNDDKNNINNKGEAESQERSFVVPTADGSKNAWHDLPSELEDVARLSIAEYNSPHHILDHVESGLVDIFTLSFVNECTDAGVALTFEFPASAAPSSASTPTSASDPASTDQSPPPQREPLGIDLWHSSHATSLAPLGGSTDRPCGCYTCRTHHRAYVHHLLNAKEMLAWSLLQIHNHAVVARFFDALRDAIVNDGSDREAKGRSGGKMGVSFAEKVQRFRDTYERELPAGSGRGPRVRGYQFKSEGPGEEKKNPVAYTTLDS